MNKPKYHIVSLSGGKDSTAMLLMMLERGMQVDCILFCDTGLEFPGMYAHLDRLEKYIDRPITRVKAEHSFEYYFKDHNIPRGRSKKFVEQFGKNKTGYGWAGPRMRWCTNRLKDKPRETFLNGLRDRYEIIEYVGIAADEEYRLNRKVNQKENSHHPLVDWGITEKECLQYCYDHGFDWDGLYRDFKRVSCWCCPLQSLVELRVLYRKYPKLWAQLKAWDEITWRKFRADYSVAELEARFDFEEKWKRSAQREGTKQYYSAMKEYIKEQTNGRKNIDPRQSV